MRKDNCIHITHNGADAVGCALIIALFFPEYSFLKNTYFCKASEGSLKLNSILDDISNKGKEIPEFIIISDLSIDYYTINRLKKLPSTTKIIGIDHHETNEVDKKCDWFHVIRHNVYDDNIDCDIRISACEYMLRYFTMKKIKIDEFQKPYIQKLKKLIYIISRYDTLEYKKHSLEKEYEFNEDIVSVLSDFIGPYETFKGLLTLYDKYRIEGCYKESKLIPTNFEELYSFCLLSKNLAISNVEETTRILRTKLYTLAVCFNNNNYYKECAEYICDKYKDIDVCVMLNPSEIKIFLKTNKKNINLALFAKKYLNVPSGHLDEVDGHCNEKIMSKIIDLYYNKMVYLNKNKKNIKDIKKIDLSIVDFFEENK